MKTLATGSDVQQILLRVETVSLCNAAQWGRMNAHQMVCHLCDAMRVPLGEKAVSDAELSPLQRSIIKWGALYFPRKWPKNVQTRPEIDQCRMNAPLNDFEADRRTASELVRRLCNANVDGVSHPFFGPLTRAQWLRWGWLHTDHHLRQFGR
jgi:Protein of unknown function (DUF1569)